MVLLLAGSAGAIFFHRGALTPIAIPIVRMEGLKESASKEFPLLAFSETERSMDFNAPYREQFHFIDIEREARQFMPYWISMILFLGGFATGLFDRGHRVGLRFTTLSVVIVFAASMVGAILLAHGIRIALIAFDAMSLSGGSDPASFGLEVGRGSRTILAGWAFLLAASVYLSIRNTRSSVMTGSETLSTGISKTLSNLGMGILAIALGLAVFLFLSCEPLKATSSKTVPEEVAKAVSSFVSLQFPIYLLVCAATLSWLGASLGRTRASA